MSDDKTVIQFELVPHLGLTAADDLASTLKGQRGSDIIIDASQTEHLGAQCLQILLSAAKTWQADRCSFSIVNPSTSFRDGLALLGVAESALQAEAVPS